MKDKLKVHKNWSKYDLKLSTKLNQIFLKHLLNLTDLKETLLTLNIFSTSLKSTVMQNWKAPYLFCFI